MRLRLPNDPQQYSPAPQWRTSSHCQAGTDCVQAASLPGHLIGLRDSKAPTNPILSLLPSQWRSFTDAIRDGRYDLA